MSINLFITGNKILIFLIKNKFGCEIFTLNFTEIIFKTFIIPTEIEITNSILFRKMHKQSRL